jgi:outer membrane protein assembly factor BamA
LAFRGQKYFRDFEEEDQRKELRTLGYMTVPFDRVSSVSMGIGATDRDDIFLDEESEDEFFSERFYLASLDYDTVTGRYLIPTKGRRASIFYQQGIETAGGEEEYKSGGVGMSQYIPLHRESTWASRLFYGRSVGEDPQVFRLGGVDRIRAIPSGSLSFRSSNVIYGSTEFRYRLKYLNARTAFLFPDFFFKAAYLIVFDDFGYGWDTREERKEFKTNRLTNSTGLGISWPTFILQSFKIDITVQWAHHTNSGGNVWYITLGPSF